MRRRKITHADYKALSPAKVSLRCLCCSKAGIDRPGILRGRGKALCEPCWTDPANAFAECKHGVPA